MEHKELNQTERPRYATVFYDVRRQLNVSWTEYIVLDMIYHLQGKLGYCYKTAKSIGEDVGEDKRSIQYILQKLIKQGYIERLTDYTMKVTDKYVDNAIMGGTNNLYGVQKNDRGVQMSRRGVQKSAQITGGKNNIRITKNNKAEIKREFDSYGHETLQSIERRLGVRGGNR